MVKDYTAGDPTRPDVKWTNLTLGQIAERLAEAGTPVSVTVVKQLLRKHRYIKLVFDSSFVTPIVSVTYGIYHNTV